MDVIRQKRWADSELIAQGFRYYPSRKIVTLARVLPAAEAPLVIQTDWDTLVAQAGYYIAYRAGDTIHSRLEDYHPRPIRPDVFHQSYASYNDPNWKPTPAEAHLRSLGCSAYYKKVGVWAKRLSKVALVQSMESKEPAIVPPGAWVCVGIMGEPWSTSDEWIRTRYHVPDSAFLASFSGR